MRPDRTIIKLEELKERIRIINTSIHFHLPNAIQNPEKREVAILVLNNTIPHQSQIATELITELTNIYLNISVIPEKIYTHFKEQIPSAIMQHLSEKTFIKHISLALKELGL